ncbi:hypothetical protein BC938DRAFT_481701 [Jimgerdemannia flammicorona]|uniref:Uncharacterized protein n=1 Tax=Jimgerdemannia flammicorona TaxID=994334 RepID=A0A433QFL2_9FUNG|nr:hypothetical protein BC938DRAFT_481701 [Jimgerdemannia flammicorona]
MPNTVVNDRTSPIDEPHEYGMPSVMTTTTTDGVEKQLEYYQLIGTYLTGIATFASGLIFQALTSVVLGPSNPDIPDVGGYLSWAFFVVNLAIIVGLVGFFSIPYRDTHKKNNDLREMELKFMRFVLYAMLFCVIVGFCLIYMVVYTWNQTRNSAIAGWASFGVVLVVWASSVYLRWRTNDGGPLTLG